MGSEAKGEGDVEVGAGAEEDDEEDFRPVSESWNLSVRRVSEIRRGSYCIPR